MAQYFEIQVSAARVAELFRMGLLQLGALDIEPSFEYQGRTTLVDGFELNAPATLEGRVPRAGAFPSVVVLDTSQANPQIVGRIVTGARTPTLVQVLDVRLVAVDDLEMNNGDPSPVTRTQVTLAYRFLAGQTPGGDVNIRFELVDVDLGPVLGGVSNAEALAASLRNSAGNLPFTNPTSIGGFINPLNQATLADLGIGENTHAAINGPDSMVAIRVELGPVSASLGEWETFLGGSIDDLLDGRDWAVLIDKRQLQATFRTALDAWKTVNEAPEADPRLVGTSIGPMQWLTYAATETTITSAVEDACPGPNPFDWVDVDFELNAKLEYNRPAADKLELLGRFNWNVDGLDQFICASTMAFLGPFVASFMTDFAAGSDSWPGDQLSVEEYLGSNLLGPLAYSIGTFVSISQGMNAMVQMPVGNFVEIETDDDKAFHSVIGLDLVVARYDVPDTNVVLEMRATMNSLRRSGRGLILSGTMAATL